VVFSASITPSIFLNLLVSAATARATSSHVPARPTGREEIVFCFDSSVVCSAWNDEPRIRPGATALTLMPLCPISSASPRVHASTAPFAAAYTIEPA